MCGTLRGLLAILVLGTTAPLSVAQVTTATLPVGNYPDVVAVNTSTNRIYAVDSQCDPYPSPYPCSTQGTVTVIDGNTNNVVGTVNVGYGSDAVAVNSVTNKIYVGNACGNDPNCQSLGTVTVIDGATLQTSTVQVGYAPSLGLHGIAINPVTNEIYVANYCVNSGWTAGCYGCENGTNSAVTAINGTTLATQSVPAGCGTFGVAVDTVTNTIYAVSSGSNGGPDGLVTVINGTTLGTQSVPTGGFYSQDVAIDSVTNQIYASNLCGSDPNCLTDGSNGTVTVIDGATLSTQTVAAGYFPVWLAVDSATNMVYTANVNEIWACGQDMCSTSPAVTVINGATLSTALVPICGASQSPFYADTQSPGDVEVNTVTNKIYTPCENFNSGQPPGKTVTVIDGATNATFPIAVGDQPNNIAINSVTNTLYTPNILDKTVSVIGAGTKAQLNNVTPCRLVDTRPGSGGSGPIQGGSYEAFNLPQLAQQKQQTCPGLNLSSAISYSLNVTLVPSNGPVGYLTIWPDSQIQPVVSTMNSDGRIKANAAMVSAGLNGAVDVYVANTANIILDIDAYFAPSGTSTLQYFPLTPCRIADTRQTSFPPGLGAPYLMAQQQRSFPLLNATTCFQQIPSGVNITAYSLNFTAVPHGPLGYLTVWPTGQTQPVVSTLNAPTGVVTANAAIVPAGSGGAIEAYVYNDSDLIIDIDGYFAAPATGGLSAYPTPPCRVLDTRTSSGGNGPFTGTLSPPVNVLGSPCPLPSTVPPQSLAYNFNATVVPYHGESLGYLTLWPVGEDLPVVSTLNAYDGAITSNMAVVPAGTNGEINAYAGYGTTDLILDISGFYAP